MKDGAPARTILIASNFPPIRGSAGVMFDGLARAAPDEIIVIAPRVNYADGLPIIGWREHDKRSPNRIIRLRQLRLPLRPRDKTGRVRGIGFTLSDLSTRIRLAATVLGLIVSKRVRLVCIGEVQANGWLTDLLRLVPMVRTVAFVHADELGAGEASDPVPQRWRRALLTVDKVALTSQLAFRAAREMLGPLPPVKICLLENGVDVTRFRPGDKREDLLRFYGLESGFIYVSVCRLLEKKGIDNAIRAFALIGAEAPGSRYLIVGAGPRLETLKAVAAEEGVAGRVVFAGQVADDELADHFRLGDAFVMPNRELPSGETEGFGLVFLEANSCGLPVIAGRDGGSIDAVEDGVNGLLVDGRSTADIAGAMRRLRDDEGLRDRLRRGGLALAERSAWTSKARAFLDACLDHNSADQAGAVARLRPERVS